MIPARCKYTMVKCRILVKLMRQMRVLAMDLKTNGTHWKIRKHSSRMSLPVWSHVLSGSMMSIPIGFHVPSRRHVWSAGGEGGLGLVWRRYGTTPLVDRQTPVKTIPSRNFAGGNMYPRSSVCRTARRVCLDALWSPRPSFNETASSIVSNNFSSSIKRHRDRAVRDNT